MSSISSVSRGCCRESDGCPTLAKKVEEKRSKENTPSRKRNISRHTRRSWKKAGEEGLQRLIAYRQSQRADIKECPVTENSVGSWIPEEERRGHPRSGIQRHTPKKIIRAEVKKCCDLEVLQQKKENHRRRTL